MKTAKKPTSAPAQNGSILKYLTSSKKITGRHGPLKTPATTGRRASLTASSASNISAPSPKIKKQKLLESKTRRDVEQSPQTPSSKAQTPLSKPQPLQPPASVPTTIVNDSKAVSKDNPKLSKDSAKAVVVDKENVQPTITAQSSPSKTKKRAHDASLDEEIIFKPPPMLISNTPIQCKSVSGQEPAYKRFAPLLQTKSKSSLELPPSHQKLLVLFNALESVLNYQKSRNAVAIFHKIQNAVEVAAKVKFNADLFAQIVTIYPGGYVLQKVFTSIADERIQSFTIEIPNDAVVLEFLSKLDRSNQTVKFAPTLSKKSNGIANTYNAVEKLSKQKLARSLEFQKLLEDHVKTFHDAFLKEKGLEWTISPILPKWHPDFNLAIVESIPLAELPLKKPMSYLETLKKKANMKTAPKKEEPKPQEVEKPAEQQLGKDGKPLSRAQALLERVRARQRLKEEKAKISTPPEFTKRNSMLSRIRSIASSLLMHTRTMGKSVIGITEAVAHLQLTFRDLFQSDDQWYEHIQLLAEVAPSFCKLEVLVSCAHLPKLQAHHHLLRFLPNCKVGQVARIAEQQKNQMAEQEKARVAQIMQDNEQQKTPAAPITEQPVVKQN